MGIFQLRRIVNAIEKDSRASVGRDRDAPSLRLGTHCVLSCRNHNYQLNIYQVSCYRLTRSGISSNSTMETEKFRKAFTAPPDFLKFSPKMRPSQELSAHIMASPPPGCSGPGPF